MARAESPKGITPEDPLNSYRPASFRGVIITGILIMVVFVGLWLAYGAALNNPELQRQTEGNPEVQGPAFPGGGNPVGD